MEQQQVSRNFIIDGQERSVQDILSKLKFISKIKENEKVDVGSLSLIASEGLASRLYRSTSNLISYSFSVLKTPTVCESRVVTLDFIRFVVGDAFDLVVRCFARPQEIYQQIGRTIIEQLQECKKGISNLAKTYRDDRMFVSKLESLIMAIETRIEDITQNHANSVRSVKT